MCDGTCESRPGYPASMTEPDPAVLKSLELSVHHLDMYARTIRREPDLVESIRQLTAAVRALAGAPEEPWTRDPAL